MIIVLLILSAIAFFISFIYLDKILPRTICVILSGLLVVGSLTAIVGNYHSHFGMDKIVHTKTVKIYSASGNAMNIVLYQNIGTSGQKNVFIYKKHPEDTKMTHTQANEATTNKVITSHASSAKLKIDETRWQYKSQWAKFLFEIADNDHQLIRRENQFYLPKSWLKLSTTQAKELKKEMASSVFKANAQKQAAVYVRTKLKAAIIKNPSLATNQSRQQALAKSFSKEFRLALIKQTISEITKK